MITGQTSSVRIYNAIKQSCLAISEVKHFALWNNQVQKIKEGDKNPIRFPSIFISFENEYENLSVGRQQINGIFILRICLQSLKFKDEEVLLFKDYIYQQLSNELPKHGFSEFKRRFEIQDTDHDSILVWEQEYSYSFIDDSASDVLIPHFPWVLETDVHY